MAYVMIWNNVELSSLPSNDSLQKTISQGALQPSTNKISLEITHLKFHSNLPAPNELRYMNIEGRMLYRANVVLSDFIPGITYPLWHYNALHKPKCSFMWIGIQSFIPRMHMTLPLWSCQVLPWGWLYAAAPVPVGPRHINKICYIINKTYSLRPSDAMIQQWDQPSSLEMIDAFVVENGIFLDTQFNTMVIDALEPCSVTASTTSVLDMQYKQVIVVHGERFWLSVKFISVCGNDKKMKLLSYILKLIPQRLFCRSKVKHQW